MRYDDAAWRESMRIRLDYNNMLTAFTGEHGISSDVLKQHAPLYARAAEAVSAKRETMKWRALPYEQEETVLRIEDIARRIIEDKDIDAFVVLGIGGSALGPIAVQQALNHLHYNELTREKRGAPKLYILDNIDPERIKALTDIIDIKRTVFNVITKSGSTSETMSQLLYFTRMLKDALGEDWTKRLIATTDSNKGNLIKIARDNALETFYVPDGVGGRFSELCPVGLLAAAVCGINIRELLCGARYMDGLCASANASKNIALMSAALEYEAMGIGANISVLMPYADSLRYISDWYAQLWAESLGKLTDNEGRAVHTGQTPVKALGVTDQHSQVQLYTEGPFDKTVTFIGVEKYREDVTIPHSFDGVADVAFLSGHTFSELINSERLATEYALTRSGHMNKTIILPEVNAFTVGALLYLFEMQTAYAGELLNINAFDQPGVEEGKNATYALLGKTGYDGKRKELDARPKKDGAYII